MMMIGSAGRSSPFPAVAAIAEPVALAATDVEIVAVDKPADSSAG